MEWIYFTSTDLMVSPEDVLYSSISLFLLRIFLSLNVTNLSFRKFRISNWHFEAVSRHHWTQWMLHVSTCVGGSAFKRSFQVDNRCSESLATALLCISPTRSLFRWRNLDSEQFGFSCLFPPLSLSCSDDMYSAH